MINPATITNYNATDNELQEVLIFWICVAGKTARTISRAVDRLLNNLKGKTPFEKIKSAGKKQLPGFLKDNGIGCYSIKSRSLWELVNSNIDLRNCTVDELENLYGIGPKTARCFVIHSRADAKYAGLDTHVLKFLRDKGHNVPKSTPAGKKQYRELELLFLNYVKKSGKTVADFDLEIWRRYSGNNNVQ